MRIRYQHTPISRLIVLGVVLGVVFSFLTAIAQAQPAQASSAHGKRTYTRPVSSVTVKVMPASTYNKRAAKADRTVTRDGKPAPWIITALDVDSCVAWISSATPSRDAAEIAAFRACQTALKY